MRQEFDYMFMYIWRWISEFNPIQKRKKMVFDSSLLNTQHHRVRIKREAIQEKEWPFSPHVVVVAMEKRANFTYLDIYLRYINIYIYISSL